MSSFPSILLDRLWHSTTYPRYKHICRDGAILPNPDMPDSARWHAGKGPDHYPYVRSLGGVSLFDFTGFDAKKYSKKYAASWYTFVPLNEIEGNKVWIEIDRGSVLENLIEGRDLLERWKQENALRRSLMPIIEVAHIGPIFESAFSRVLHFSNGSWHQIK